MSRENIEVVRRKLQAHNVDDTAGFLDQWDPECEWFTVTGSQMDAAPYRGHEGIRRYLAERAELWLELRFDTEEALEGKDDDDVVVVGFLRGRVAQAGSRSSNGSASSTSCAGERSGIAERTVTHRTPSRPPA